MSSFSRLNPALLTAGLLLVPGSAPWAQELARVEITGSAIKRAASETALPVLVLRRDDIQRSGATSTTDLMRKLTVLQGATGESASVGNGTFGFSGASIHNLGENRTLVLLNGRRMAQFGGQTLTGFAAGYDLNALPLSLIERVEVLTDGASAYYGADAVAGVVNFITRREVAESEATVGFSHPAGGAREARISVTQGFGSLQADGYSVLLSAAKESRSALHSSQRPFARTGNLEFQRDGKRYRLQNLSGYTIPANIEGDPSDPADPDSVRPFINPYLLKNGFCPDNSFRITAGQDDYCGFDYTRDVEIYPERRRESLYASLSKRIDQQEIFTDLLFSRNQQTSRIASVPGVVPIAAGTALHDEYILPLGIQGDTNAYYRVFDAGSRVSRDTATFHHVTLGSRGLLHGWDYETTLTSSRSRVSANISGFPGARALDSLLASGSLNPFVGAGQQSAAGAAALRSIDYNGYWDGGVSQLTALAVRGTTEGPALPAGPVTLGVGANVNVERFQSRPSLFAQGLLSDPAAGTLADAVTPGDTRFGDTARSVPYSANRRSIGVFGELLIPASAEVDVGTAVRLDRFSDFGSAATTKVHVRWTPSPSLLLRGSVGTGFRAPSIPQVKGALQLYGGTVGAYDCTPELQAVATELNAQCRPGTAQYDQFSSGNGALKPEKSVQASLGVRLEPSASLSLGADLWGVAIRDAFGVLPESAVFGNPTAYRSSFGTAVEPLSGTTYLAFVADNRNLGKRYSSGIDLDASASTRWSAADWRSQLTLTYMLREIAQLDRNGPYFSAVGDHGPLNTVTFRWQGRWVNTLRYGDWAHALAVNFKSGYRDALTTVEVLDASGAVTGSEDLRLKVPAYATLDWQTAYQLRRHLSLELGVLNLMDQAPPLALSISGQSRGFQIGYDDRYYDARGRTFYANLSYKF